MAVQAGQARVRSVAPFTNLRRETTRAKRRFSPYLAVIPLVPLDVVGIAFSLFAAHHLRFYAMEYGGPYSAIFYARLIMFVIPLWVLTFALFGLYHPDRLFGGLREYASVFNASAFVLVGLVVYGFFNRDADRVISRMWLAIVWAFSALSVVSIRFGYRRLVYWMRKKGLFVRRALVVGANEEGRAIVSQLSTSPTAGLRVLGFVDPLLDRGTEVAGLPVLGDPSKLFGIIHALEIEEIIVVPTALSRQALLDIYRDWEIGNNVRISLSSGLYELFTTGAQVNEVGFIPLVSLNRTRITGLDAVVKRVLDYVGAFVAVILLSPLFALIAILIRRDSPGPVIHRRRVVGLHGREFDAYKFRSMVADADSYLEAHPELREEWEQNGKIRNDPRITRVGRFLRSSSLDELPQLFNVLKGEMSLVGPRMITPSELRHFGRWRHNLLTVRPGITGLWQISGRSDLTYEERVRLDMYYIRNYTIWQDLKVLLNTVWVVLKGRGAY